MLNKIIRDKESKLDEALKQNNDALRDVLRCLKNGAAWPPDFIRKGIKH